MNLNEILWINAYWQVNKKIAKEVWINAALLLAYFINKESFFRKKWELVNTKFWAWFFYLTTEKIEEDVFMKRTEQETAIKKLEEAWFLEKVLAWVPARKHFKILAENIFNFLKNSWKSESTTNKFAENLQTWTESQLETKEVLNSNKQDCRKSTTQFAENLQTIYKENIYKNNINNNKKNKNNKLFLLKKRDWLKKYWEYKNVKLTEEEIERLKKDFSEIIFEKYLKILDEWIELKWYKYKNHNLAMRKWMEKDWVRKTWQPKNVNLRDII